MHSDFTREDRTMSASDLPKPYDLQHDDAGKPQVLYTADQLRAYGDKRAREAVEALQRLAKSFPTDIDMKEAGWEQAEIDEACAAYDQAYRLLAAAPTPGEKT